MKTPFSVDRISARRYLLHTQGLLSDPLIPTYESGQSESVMQAIRQLECVQIDPVSAVERNQHLALAARISDYVPKYLDQLLEQGKTFEYFANAACVIPMEDYPIFKPIRETIKVRLEQSLDHVQPVVKHVFERLEHEGPLSSRAFKSEKHVHGYWDNQAPKTKETSHAINLLLDTGMIRVVKREGKERFFDLTDRTVPEDILREAESIGTSVAKQALIEKYMRAYRLFDIQDSRFGWQKMSASERRLEIKKRVQEESVVPIEIKDVNRQYFILSEDLDKLEDMARRTSPETTNNKGPIRFLPPLDNLLWRRERIVDLFEFTYKWEIYIPQSKRRYGYYAMPILYGDQLIGRIDPRLDRKNERLNIRMLQIEPTVEQTSSLYEHLRAGLRSFMKFHGAREITIEQTEPSELMKNLL